MVVLPFSSSFLAGGVNIHQTLQDFRTSPSQRGEKLVINLVTGSHWQSDTSPFWTGVDNPVFMFNLNFQAGLFQRNVCNDLLPIIISLSFFYFKKHLLTKHPPSRHQTSTSNHPKKKHLTWSAMYLLARFMPTFRFTCFSPWKAVIGVCQENDRKHRG